jgi:hypothetical protein
MTKRGFEFLKKWISDNINAGSSLDTSDALLNSAVHRLREDAGKEGIAWLEMADDSDDIKDALLEAMKR